MKMSQLTEIKPNEAGLASEARAVGKRWADMLNAMEQATSQWVVKGKLAEDTDEFRRQIIDRLRAEGWRVKVNNNDKWTVLPPTDY